jgi:hypothetical protein
MAISLRRPDCVVEDEGQLIIKGSLDKSASLFSLIVAATLETCDRRSSQREDHHGNSLRQMNQ